MSGDHVLDLENLSLHRGQLQLLSFRLDRPPACLRHISSTASLDSLSRFAVGEKKICSGNVESRQPIAPLEANSSAGL
uniref:Uncharacterized protein n=1 Tax=Trichuris muris TaxID=70415 RepID=A0A5S6Q3X8_TRIMR